MFLRLAGALATALAFAGVMPAAHAEKMDARYEIYGFAGMHVLTDRTSTEETPQGYALATNLSTRGFASVFVDMQSHSEVVGSFAGHTPRPMAYRAEIWRNGTDRSFALKYLDDGDVVDNVRLASTAKSYLDGVQLRGTVDQLTAYYLVERQLAQNGSCRMVIPVFDGNELYRLRFSDVRDETLVADGHQDFAGPAHLCEVARDMIVANPDRQEGTYDRGRLWYARPAPGSRVVPVRMEFDTPFGDVRGYLAELGGGGLHLEFLKE